MRTSRFVLLVLALCLASSVTAQAATWDPAAQWSLAANPNGAWTYGWFNQLGGTFSTNMGAEDRGGGVQVWVGPAPSDAGLIMIGPASYLHPGSDGAVPTFRWTAPEAIVVDVNASYYDASGATTTDVHVILNGTSLFDGNINPTSTTQQYAGQLTVAAGDMIDFAVGWGNGEFYSDLTGLNASITTVPEPCTMLALAAGIGLVIRRRRS